MNPDNKAENIPNDDLFKDKGALDEIKQADEPQQPPTPTPTPKKKSKIEFNVLTVILAIIVVILVIVVVLLIIKKPKVNNDLLLKTQEMYQETKKKNKELSDIVSDLEKKNKMLIETNEATIKTNSTLKNQLSDIQIQYSSTKDQLDEYKTREAHALEIPTTKSKSFADRKKELYDKINPPKEIIKVEEHPEIENIKLDTSDIAAQQQNITKQMTTQLKQAEQAASTEIDQSVMDAIDA